MKIGTTTISLMLVAMMMCGCGTGGGELLLGFGGYGPYGGGDFEIYVAQDPAPAPVVIHHPPRPDPPAHTPTPTEPPNVIGYQPSDQEEDAFRDELTVERVTILVNGERPAIYGSTFDGSNCDEIPWEFTTNGVKMAEVGFTPAVLDRDFEAQDTRYYPEDFEMVIETTDNTSRIVARLSPPVGNTSFFTIEAEIGQLPGPKYVNGTLFINVPLGTTEAYLKPSHWVRNDGVNDEHNLPSATICVKVTE